MDVYVKLRGNYNPVDLKHPAMIEDVFRRINNGKWEGCRFIDVAAEDPEWCNRSAASNFSSEEHKALILKALEVVEKTGYTPEFSIDDPRSKSIIARICSGCGEKTDSYITKSAQAMCLTCYEKKQK